jgi:predicted transcriptional regulator
MIRADLARELVRNGMSQNEAAEKLGITPAAVSQYIHKKRGQESKPSGQYKKLIEKAAKEVIDSSKSGRTEKIICKCCEVCRK